MSPYIFEVFSLDHIISLIVIIFLFIIFLRYNEKIGIEDDSKTFLITLSILMIFLDLSEDIVRVFTGYYSINKDLPLQLCSIGVYLGAYNLIYRNQTIFNLIFYWGFVGATNAILTPDGDLFELKIFFFYSQAYHAALIFAVLWMIIKYGMRMEYKSIFQVVLYTNVIVGIITVINFALDSNYMFLRIMPNSISPFLMGQWPTYILMVQVFSVVLVVLFISIQNYFMKPTT
ncbi:MAG: TIGR02206 family membrane protein [Candidatus Neomarinimicrobiota bacterium]|tara:strand:+ start:138 stop:830 length:693 start_codon:yes stop_codon:yes gene_type:complete